MTEETDPRTDLLSQKSPKDSDTSQEENLESTDSSWFSNYLDYLDPRDFIQKAVLKAHHALEQTRLSWLERQEKLNQNDDTPNESLGADQVLTVKTEQLGTAAQASGEILEPWGNDLPGGRNPKGMAPLGRWGRDILGEPYQAMTMQMRQDDEGAVFATLVKRTPKASLSTLEKERSGLLPGREIKQAPKCAFLFLHGRNDYFFQVELAAQLSGMGAAFYALDLRKFGRSLRPGQTIGYADDLSVYDQEIDRSINTIRAEHPGLPIVLAGHSMGGLVATLWAYHHPGELAGLLLDSAWLELQTLSAMRPAVLQVVSKIAAIKPRATVTQSKSDAYGRSLLGGRASSEFEIPESLIDFPDDPSVCGWKYFTQWKRPFSYPVPASWLQAILQGQTTVEQKVHLDCPVLSLCSTTSHAENWGPDIFRSDVILNADLIAERSAKLSNQVTIERFAGRHDLFLSDRDVRVQAYQATRRWLKNYIFCS